MAITLPSPASPLKIGTRGSPLALAQAYETRERLMKAFDLPEDAFEIVVINTIADRVLDRALKEIGGKGLFTKEIEDAMLAGKIDIAVHSTKDMAVEQPDGLVLDTFLPRENYRDAFISKSVASLKDLAEGAVVGTSSLRRRSQLLNYRPDLKVVEFRGNVQTRLKKLEDGVAEATFLAMAGLNRLGMEDVAKSTIEPEEMLPAVAQGAIGIERRSDDAMAGHLLEALHDKATGEMMACERAFLDALDGSCETPIGGLALHEGGNLWLRGEILRPDGSERIAGEDRAPIGHGAEMGFALGKKLREEAGEGFFDWD
ncbi:hydroxymethylbilane synthase [Rhodovulum sulfidophilum]|uniref:hydroxymethylbilane synthase n=1 Tax=Rhodovulum sulfidophilum TaxID=35806 RepID=UPI001389C5E4|nr:hydroxymethylbilane synthase [Rhodovulum sulfidophilum]NDK35698.1 hydroxymethylbilane synthase [Rhodovulum sulfidophilum]